MNSSENTRAYYTDDTEDGSLLVIELHLPMTRPLDVVGGGPEAIGNAAKAAMQAAAHELVKSQGMDILRPEDQPHRYVMTADEVARFAASPDVYHERHLRLLADDPA